MKRRLMIASLAAAGLLPLPIDLQPCGKPAPTVDDLIRIELAKAKRARKAARRAAIKSQSIKSQS